MFVRNTLILCLFGLVGYATPAFANSCSNVDVMGSFDESGLRESENGIYAVGTFRIFGEEDENKQPLFNLSEIVCQKQSDTAETLECKLTQAILWPQSGNPDPDKPNCSLDLETATYEMKELQKGVLAGFAERAACINTTLTIDRNTKRVYLSFTKTKGADKYDKIRPGTCGSLPPTEVLMNCTGWPKLRKQGRTPPRYCDFSGADDK